MDQCSCWNSEGSILSPLFFLIYINELSDNLTSYAKYFVNDASLFSVVGNVNTSAKELNDDLEKVNEWAFQWKVSFNPDPRKQVHEVIFSCKSKRPTHQHFSIIIIIMSLKAFLKNHLGAILDFKSAFEDHLNNMLAKVNKAVGLLCKL